MRSFSLAFWFLRLLPLFVSWGGLGYMVVYWYTCGLHFAKYILSFYYIICLCIVIPAFVIGVIFSQVALRIWYKEVFKRKGRWVLPTAFLSILLSPLILFAAFNMGRMHGYMRIDEQQVIADCVMLQGMMEDNIAVLHLCDSGNGDYEVIPNQGESSGLRFVALPNYLNSLDPTFVYVAGEYVIVGLTGGGICNYEGIVVFNGSAEGGPLVDIAGLPITRLGETGLVFKYYLYDWRVLVRYDEADDAGDSLCEESLADDGRIKH